ncbi:integrase core domain-containing protein [Zunongwangia endophytica]|uniref:integrase core domain-containing protein n=1 Tax=Zunongwangia endophytica TaxID=1808945 RepID=UPI00338EEE7F
MLRKRDGRTCKWHIKRQFYLDQTFDSLQHAKRATENAINLYNEIRLHLSLDYQTPNMVYKLTA